MSRGTAIDRGLPGLIARRQHAVGHRCTLGGGRKRVSRRVGELASERIGGQASMWSTRRLNDMDFGWAWLWLAGLTAPVAGVKKYADNNSGQGP